MMCIDVPPPHARHSHAKLEIKAFVDPEHSHIQKNEFFAFFGKILKIKRKKLEITYRVQTSITLVTYLLNYLPPHERNASLYGAQNNCSHDTQCWASYFKK